MPGALDHEEIEYGYRMAGPSDFPAGQHFDPNTVLLDPYAKVISGRDVYGLTAAAITKGALIAAGRGFSASGALAPSQAFDPEDFLGALDEFELRWRVDHPQEAVAAPISG